MLNMYVESMMIIPVTKVSIMTLPVLKLNKKQDFKISITCWSSIFSRQFLFSVFSPRKPAY